MQIGLRIPLLPGLLALSLATVLAAADISGRWSFVWNTEGGIRHTEWVVTQQGEVLSIRTQDGQSLSGTLDGDKMIVEGNLNSPEAGYSANLRVEGTLQDGKLAGKGTWDQYAMTFTATRGR